jgi:hypothetical protein
LAGKWNRRPVDGCGFGNTTAGKPGEDLSADGIHFFAIDSHAEIWNSGEGIFPAFMIKSPLYRGQGEPLGILLRAYSFFIAGFWREFNSRRSLLFRRAALFLWITPFEAARSNSRIAVRMAASLDSLAAVLAVPTADRARLRIMRFRTRFRSLLRMRFMADRKLANLTSWI